MEIMSVFESAGAKVLRARSLTEALSRSDHFSAAVLDYQLGEDRAPPLCARLKERQIPFMFYTGDTHVQGNYPDAVIVHKPATASALVAAVTGLVSS